MSFGLVKLEIKMYLIKKPISPPLGEGDIIKDGRSPSLFVASGEDSPWLP